MCIWWQHRYLYVPRKCRSKEISNRVDAEHSLFYQYESLAPATQWTNVGISMSNTKLIFCNSQANWWNFIWVDDMTRIASVLTTIKEKQKTTWSKVIPSLMTSDNGLQQSSMLSLNHLQGPFHFRLGSTCRAFNTIARLASPQKAGSSCVWNCSMSEKNDSIVPSFSASAMYCFPT